MRDLHGRNSRPVETVIAGVSPRYVRMYLVIWLLATTVFLALGIVPRRILRSWRPASYDRPMRIFRSRDAPVGPVDPATFLGGATVQRLAHDATGVAVGVYRVTFSDGGRTNWHKHSGPQWLFVVEGRVRVRAEGGDSQDLEAGDAVVVAPGERHWHGAVPGSVGTHIAVNVNAATTWMEPVSDEEYAR